MGASSPLSAVLLICCCVFVMAQNGRHPVRPPVTRLHDDKEGSSENEQGFEGAATLRNYSSASSMATVRNQVSLAETNSNSELASTAARQPLGRVRTSGQVQTHRDQGSGPESAGNGFKSSGRITLRNVSADESLAQPSSAQRRSTEFNHAGYNKNNESGQFHKRPSTVDGSTTAPRLHLQKHHLNVDGSFRNVGDRHDATKDSGFHTSQVQLSGEDIVTFPEPSNGHLPSKAETSYVPRVKDKLPECANGTTFCEAAENYPSAYLNSVLSFNTTFSEFFGRDVVLQEIDVKHRIDGSEDIPLCASLEQVVYPKMAQNSEDKWLFVVNQDQFKQGVRVEKCVKQGPCAFTEGFPVGYKATCQQKYIYRKLVALKEDGKPSSDTFRLPSCCACHVTTEGVSSRASRTSRR